MKRSRFVSYAWGLLAYNLAVILWGAYVRATGSGAGCGSHWPLCNGQVIPRAPQTETLIEFAHRLTSGLAFLAVLGLFIWAWRAYAWGHRVRWAATLAMVFMVTEALIGAGLVVFELVGENVSLARALSIAAHLMNTFLLLASLTLTAWWAGGAPPIRPKGAARLAGLLGLGLLGTLILGVSGAVTALGDTLFPARSLAEGLSQDLSATAHFLIRLRLFHPLIAVSVSLYLMLVTLWFHSSRSGMAASRLARALVLLLLVQLAAGVVNVVLLAPVWMQLVHLFLADAIWVVLVLLTAAGLAENLPAQYEVLPGGEVG